MKNKKGTYRRLPNGFGSIVKLSGNRRKPYAARLSASGTATGQNTPRALGYFETWQQAYEVLAEYNKSPYDIDARQITFAEVYDLMIDRKSKAPGGIGKASIQGYQAAYKHSSALHKQKFIEIKAMQLQLVMDNLAASTGKATMELIKNLWLQMWSYAEECEIVPKNIAKFVKINKEGEDEHSVPLTRSEIDLLWNRSEELPCALALVLCYTGFRISAYTHMRVDLTEKVLQGGVKTKAGKDRIVPIHSRILPLVQKLLAEHLLFGEPAHKNREIFKNGLQIAGVELKNHTPHDARATFTTELTRAGVPDLHIKRLLGHASGDITKDIYTTVYVEELRKSIEKLP